MNKLILFIFLTLIIKTSVSQNINKILFEQTLDSLNTFLKSSNKNSFKEAVFKVENTFTNDKLNYDDFIKNIKALSIIGKTWLKFNPQNQYKHSDSLNFSLNFAIYKLLKDTVKLQSKESEYYFTKPYTYDFEDFFGHKDWSNMFVTKLLATHKGNCHSLPYLYKILADELGATCWLSFAPNHIYIKNRCQKTGWYNTELTSGDFPTDAWILTSGYIPVDAVRSGIYMDTLSNQQAIAQCVLDLAKGYEFQTKNYEDGFILKCCNLTLKYHPLNVQALLLKAETLKKIYEKHGNVVLEIGTLIFDEMEKLYTNLFELGYREMPDKMYMQWLSSIKKERNKYTNKQLKAALNKH